MANHASAVKRIRRNDRKAIINGDRRNTIRTSLKKVEIAIDLGDAPTASEALKNAQPLLYKGVSKGLFHKKTAARKMSRLSARIKVIASK